MNKSVVIFLGFLSVLPVLTYADVSRECRGVAAGVVSAMKSNDEIANEDIMLIAVKAARRACVAALEGFSNDDRSDTAESADTSAEETSSWEFFTQKKEKKAGNKRLERLRN